MFCHNLAIIIDRCFNRLSEGMKMGLCMRWQAVVLLHFGKSIHLDVNMCQSEAYLPEGMSLVPAVPLWCWLYLRLGPGFPSPPSEVQDLLVPRQPLHTHPQTVSSHMQPPSPEHPAGEGRSKNWEQARWHKHCFCHQPEGSLVPESWQHHSKVRLSTHLQWNCWKGRW